MSVVAETGHSARLSSCPAALTDERERFPLSNAETDTIDRAHCSSRAAQQSVSRGATHGKVLDKVSNLEQWWLSIRHVLPHRCATGACIAASG